MVSEPLFHLALTFASTFGIFRVFSPSQNCLFMPLPLSVRLQKRVATWPWRRVGVLAGISLALALMLVIYLFGVSDHFFGRLFSAFFVLCWLLAVTFLAVVPFVTWATSHWFGRGWAEASTPASRSRRVAGAAAARSNSSPAASRRPENRKALEN